MNSRERIITALNHKEPDLVPVDFGGSVVTGMSVSTVYLLRQALKLDPPKTPVKVIEPLQMLGELKPDLLEIFGADVVSVGGLNNIFGFKNENWKEWTAFDGTPVLVPGNFNTLPEANGDILMYPGGDKSAPASGRMPKGGFYFDALIRQPPLDEEKLNFEDNTEEFQPVTAEELAHFKKNIDKYYQETDKAIFANFGGTAFGDIALVPATWLKNPKGIRELTEWYMSALLRRDYIYKVFEKQCAIALQNLKAFYSAVGNKVNVVYLSGADFGTQTGSFISPEIYKDLYQPFHKQINGWVHKNTGWKTFMHSCGSVSNLIDLFIEAGFDILNPVQCSAFHMEPAFLKEKFGKKLTFWGGGVDTQKTLPFGTPVEVAKQVKERIKIFGKDGGFVFNTVHNIQAKTPVGNILALLETLRKYRKYPL